MSGVYLFISGALDESNVYTYGLALDDWDINQPVLADIRVHHRAGFPSYLEVHLDGTAGGVELDVELDDYASDGWVLIDPTPNVCPTGHSTETVEVDDSAFIISSDLLDLSLYGDLTLGRIQSLNPATGILVTDSTNMVQQSTPAQILALIGAAPATSYAFGTVRSTVADVVADALSDMLTLTSGNAILTIAGTAATDTVTFTVDETQIDHNNLLNYDPNEHLIGFGATIGVIGRTILGTWIESVLTQNYLPKGTATVGSITNSIVEDTGLSTLNVHGYQITVDGDGSTNDFTLIDLQAGDVNVGGELRFTANYTGVFGNPGMIKFYNIGDYVAYVASILDSAFDAGDLIFGTRATGVGSFTTEKMRIKSTGLVGIGTSSPFALLNTASSNAANGAYFDTYDDGATYTSLRLRKSDTDTIGTAAETDSADVLGEILFVGVNNIGPSFATAATIQAVQDGASGAGAFVPANLILSANKATGVNTNQLVLSGPDGYIGMGTVTPVSTLELYSSSASPVLTITGAHATDYDPQIQFRTDVVSTTKATVGVDGTNDSWFLDMAGTKRIDVLLDGTYTLRYPSASAAATTCPILNFLSIKDAGYNAANLWVGGMHFYGNNIGLTERETAYITVTSEAAWNGVDCRSHMAFVFYNAGGAASSVFQLDTTQVSCVVQLRLVTCNDAGVDTDKFLVHGALNTVYYRTGAEVLSDIGATGGSGTLNYLAKFTPDGTHLGNSRIYDDGTNLGVDNSSPSNAILTPANVLCYENEVLCYDDEVLTWY